MRAAFFIFIFSALVSSSVLADGEWLSAAQYIKETGAHKIEHGNGATFHTRIETRSTQDLVGYENAIAKGRQSVGAAKTCDFFYQEATRIIPHGVKVTLRHATSSGGRIGCVLRYVSSSGSGSQIFFIEKIRSDIYQLALRD